MMTLRIALAALFCSLLAPQLHADGYASDANFLVYSPKAKSEEAEQRYAQSVLAEANRFRKEFALEWLGEELPTGAGRSVIYIDFSTVEDRGLTWAKDHPDRLLHNVYLSTSPSRAAGSTLRHEIVHTVLATRFAHPKRLPPWAEEGIACRFDDDARKAARNQQTAFWARTGRAPNLALLLEMPDLKALDESGYAAAASLVSFLLTRGDKQEVVRFAADGQALGWEAALRSHYGIQSYAELQSGWQAWLADTSTAG
ncbi:MAG: hypothetical protein AB7G28_05975 [Pirellulales bacterium]